MSRGERGHEHSLRKATLRLGEKRLVNTHGEFDVHFFRDLANDTTAMAISCGALDLSAPLLARVHSACVTSECLMGRDCDCAEQLEGALATIADEGRGVVYYLMQEGRGAGLTAKARDRMMVQASGNRITTFEAYASMGLPADLRRYDVVAPMSRLLGIRAPIQLLTNNPEKAAAVASVLESEKLEVCGTEAIQGSTSSFNRDYLSAKHDSGHTLDAPSRRAGALPPRPVRVFEPTSLPENSQRVVTASYFLPIELRQGELTSPWPSPSYPFGQEGAEPSDELAAESAIEWFRLSVIFDRGSERESILLTRGAASEGDESTEGNRSTAEADRSQAIDEAWALEEQPVTMRLFDRLPGPDSAGRSSLHEALCRVLERGQGGVVVQFDDRDHAEP